MTYVITQNCCNDTACVDACPVNCIHPTPEESGYATTDMLHIDGSVCIDCGACADVCPVDAITSDYELPEIRLPFIDINAMYFRRPETPEYERFRRPRPRRHPAERSQRLRVAIVGSGPSGAYAAEELLTNRAVDVSVDMFERLETPWGLARFGVAPDHGATRRIVDRFERTTRLPGFTLHCGVHVGIDVSHDQLASSYNAVIYAVGAMTDRRLDIAGEDLPGSHSATEFVAWYNGHPDYATRRFDLSSPTAVVIGNGNVALDVARILLSDPDDLAGTDISRAALEQLRHSQIREVIVVGRRGPAQAAFSLPELLGLDECAAFDTHVAPEEVPDNVLAAVRLTEGENSTGYAKVRRLHNLSRRPSSRDRRLTLRFLASPVEVSGRDRVESIRLVHNELVHTELIQTELVHTELVHNELVHTELVHTELIQTEKSRLVSRATPRIEDIDCGLVLRSIGHKGAPIAGVPFDHIRGVIPQVDGRTIDPETADTLTGVYSTGWIKRGPSGLIGSNKKCAQETVATLLEDFRAGLLDRGRRNE